VVNGRDPEKGKVCVDEMGAGDRAAFLAGDATKQETANGIVDFAIDRYGKLDIMVLNSGGVRNTAPVAEMTDEEWPLELYWNLNSIFWGMRRALQHMIPRQYGPDHCHVVGGGQPRQARHTRRRGHQARDQRTGKGGRSGGRHDGHHDQRPASGHH
jgi:NAD(P)-dependent dehydrogenase (short-subunit alcohol dehydrogenase family)